MKKLFLITYAVLILVPSLAMAQDELTLNEYVAEVLKANPDIKSMQAKVTAYEAKYHYTGVIPDPSLMFKINNMGTQYTVGQDPMSYFAIELDQQIPFPVKLHLESELAYKQFKISRQMLRQKELEIQSQAVSAFSDYYYNTESLLLLEQYLKVIDTVIGTAQQRYETGIASQQDLLRAMLERSRLEERIELIGFDLKRSTAQMNGLLGRSPDEQVPGPAGLQAVNIGYDRDALYSSAEYTSPEISISKIGVEKSRLELSKSKWSYAPDLDIGAGWMTRGYYPPGWTASVGISLPLYFWTKQRYMVKGAGAGLITAKQSQDNTEKSILAEIDASYKEAQTTYSLIDLYSNKIVPEAALTFSSAISSYTTGRVDFLTTMDALLMLIDYKQMLYQRTAEYYKALAQLSVLSGVDLIKAGKE
ncbi:MAG: TolC family protein [Deltaproteobacteria bacterium]|nr:TolC family protein [Deltaproteobacteria bacterium]MCL5276230.1 TolC family protein [Deltaproteobacteria bacterium]